ncbi:MAG TPA: SRPBCC family protein [Candidatus Sulfotelmatobacter sp.]
MAENARIPITDAGRGRSRSMSPQRWGALIGGGALAIYGITRRSPLGIALAAGGGTVALLATNRKPTPESLASATILINCRPEEVYRFWRDFENLPRFMNHLETVSKLDDRRSRWVALGPGGKPIRWDAEIINERENEHISWHSLPDSDLQVDGRVDFRPAPAGRGTLIDVRIEYSPSLGTGNALANFLNKGANFAMRQDLRRLEAMMEAGEVPTIEGQSHGRRDFITGVMRVADPTRPLSPRSNLIETFAARRRLA